MLTEDENVITRWRQSNEPIRVWIQPVSSEQGFTPDLVSPTRRAFTAWNEVGLGVAFEMVDDSTVADVHVTWIDRFDEQISGKTLWAHDDDWWIVEANIVLAIHHRGGEPLDSSAVRAIALHEVGHLIGLDHTTDTANIMTPKVRVKELSDADRATARLLYTVPPGKVK